MKTIPHKKVRDAVNNIIQNHAFYAAILLQQEIIEDNSAKNPTFYVDGKRLAYNSKFADSLSFDECKGVLVHEILHLVLLHHVRMGQRDSQLWNQAADYCINAELIKNGFVLPKGVLLDSQYDGKNAEEIYRALYLKKIKEEQEKDAQNEKNEQDSSDEKSEDSQSGAGDSGEESDDDSENDSGESDSDENQDDEGENSDSDSSDDEQDAKENDSDSDSDSDSDGEGEKEEEKPVTFGEIRPATEENAEEVAKIQSKQAVSLAKAAGELPSNSIIDMIEDSYKPKFNWREIINQFVSEITQKDYSFENPDRRFLQSGVILPDFYSKAPANVVVAIDCSGSVNLSDVRAMVEETRHCLDIMSEDKENASLTVLYFDHMVQGMEIFESGSEVKPNPKGGGGTSYSCIFKYIQDNDLKCDGIVVVTDGYCWDFGNIIPSFPVFWALTMGFQMFNPPFGTKFEFDITGE